MKKKLLMFAVVFVFTVLFVSVFAINASAASATCPVTGGKHFAGDAATCETDCICQACGEVLTPAFGHNPGLPATCGTAQKCTTCRKELNPKLGDEYCVGNREHADCTNDKVCKVCNRLMEAKLGHSIPTDAHVDCGHGIKCQTCQDFIQNAEGEHTFDWANAVTVREATETSPRLVNVKCTTCERVYEREYIGTTADSEGLGSVDAGEGAGASEIIGATLKEDSLKRADYADTAIAKKYQMLQTFKLTMEKNGVVVNPASPRTVTMTLNNAAAKVKNLKVFAMKEDGSYEEMNVVATEQGKVKFETTYFAGMQFAIVDADAPVVSEHDTGMSTGVLIAIIAGGVVAVAAVAVVLVVVLKKKKPQSAE